MKSVNLFHPERVKLSLLQMSAVFLLLFPALSSAVTLSGDSRTYLLSEETVDGSNILGAYEYLDFDLQNLGNETISFHTGGWYRYDLQDEQFGKKSNSDLQYSYLSFQSKTDNMMVNVGRVMVFEGVASERLDGGYARTDLKAGFGISAFGGIPVETNIDTPGNNLVYGGHLIQGGETYRVGVSVLREEKDSRDYRKEEGIDIWLHPFSKADITGRSSYNSMTKDWMEHAYYLSLGPFEKLRLNTEASWISYDDYFFRATLSAFFLQAGVITPGEQLRILGEEAIYPVNDKLSVAADYKNFKYDIAGDANYYGGKIRYAYTGASGSGFSAHRMDGDLDRLSYNEYRVYGYTRINKTNLAVDLIDVSYDEAISGVSNAYSIALAVLHDLTEALKVGADVEYSKDPYFDSNLKAFVKVLYHFGTKGGV